MQDQGEADAGAQMPWVGGNRLQGFGGGSEQDGVDRRLVVVGNGTDRCRQGEDQVIILDWEQIGLSVGKPLPGRTALTLGAVAVATRIVGNLEPGAVITAQDMAAEAGTATLLDRCHHLQLAEADMACVVAPPRRPVVAEDIRHLQGRPCHRRSLHGRIDVQILQRAFHLAQKFGCDLAVAGGVLQLFVAQEHLDDADILMMLEQVRGEGMATGIITLLINRTPIESTTGIIPTMANPSTSSGVCDASMMKRSS